MEPNISPFTRGLSIGILMEQGVEGNIVQITGVVPTFSEEVPKAATPLELVSLSKNDC